MPNFRFLYFSSKRPPLLYRFYSTRTNHSRGFTKSSRNSQWKRGVDPLVPVEPKEPRQWGLYAVPAVLLGFAGFGAYLHYNDERRAIPKGQGNTPISVTSKFPIIGGPFSVVDTENRVVTEQSFLGNWVLLYFGYTFSPDVGPEQLQVMAKAIDILDSKEKLNILPVFVTIDPQRDNPSHLRAYLKEFDSRIIGLTGSVGAIRHMVQEYRVFFRKVEEGGGDYLVESSHKMYLINPKMEVVRVFGAEYNANELAEAIAKELKEASSAQ